MKNKTKVFHFLALILVGIFMTGSFCFAAEVSHDYGPLVWSFNGKPVPETHWSPWLLPFAQVGFRFKIGFLFSDGTITIKTPIKLTYRYDPNAVRSGQDVTFAVKAEPAASADNTFQSAFGISFPNKLQAGFAGVSGIPIDLPWFDLPLDFWELVAKIPKVGDNISSAVSNIGVNTSTQNALPIGATESYHNQRDIITIEISKGKIEDLAPKVFGKIPEKVRTNAVRLIKLVNACSDSAALEKLQDYIEKALSVIYDAPTLTLKADPYFKIEGIRLRANIRVYIPGGKGSGLYTLYFDKPNQFQPVTFRDITPFISPGDNLTISVEDLAYEFRLIQGLTATIQLSVVPVNLDNVEKTVTYATAVLNAAADPFKIEIPILPSDSIIQSLRTNPGCTSVSVNWASPSVPLKGTVKAFDGNTPVATVIENAFKTAHNVIVPNLQKGKAYRFTVDCVNQAGEAIPGKETSATTFAGACPERLETPTCNTLTLSSPNAVAGPDYVDFSWNTNQLASTEVMFSPSPDLSLNYVMAVKKIGDVVTQGWVTREGPRQFETSHGLKLTGLDPNTKYYYNLRSWTFTNNDETNNPQDAVGSTGNITTGPALPPPTVKIRVRSPSEGNKTIPDMTVILTKNTDMDFRLSVSSGTTGVSNDVILDKGTAYTLEAQGNGCYDFGGTAELAVAANAQGPLPEVVIDVNKVAPRKGYVLANVNQGAGIAGAVISGKDSAGANISVTTTANGSWVVTSGLNPGTYNFTVSKDGYKTATTTATVNACGRFIGMPITMVPRTYTLNVIVKNQSNQAVKNATVLIKEGEATIAQLTTDLQGKVTKAGTFNDDNEHTFTIDVTPAVSATVNILPTQDFVSLTSATTSNVTVTCPADKKGPVASQINIAQAGQNAIQVSFKLDEETGKSSVEYQDPQGQIKTTPLKTGMSSPGSGFSDHTVVIQGSIIKPGTYRIKIKSKDKWNNLGESEVGEFQLFGADLWGFKIASQTGSTINFAWNKYPHADKFAKYLITIPSKTPIEITDINTTSYALNNYTSSTIRQATLTARATNSTTNLALPAVVSLPIVAGAQGGQSAGTTQTTQGGQTSGATTAGPENTQLKFLSKPTTAYVNQEASFKLGVRTSKAKIAAARCNIDWGDGKKEESDTDITVKHTFASAGQFQVKVTAAVKNKETFSDPAGTSVNVTVTAKPPKLTLLKSTKSGTPGYNFTIKAEAVSYPVGAWTLAFGDGNSETGTGNVNKVINHVYASPGSYTVEFSITDSNGTQTKKSLSL
ncbi:MAG: PKD domain-containing protein, partial [Candidatus Omnitrophota bacterium]|nr:PKD domain-containing protein [Candidatus Omnitrophota bacterium]